MRRPEKKEIIDAVNKRKEKFARISDAIWHFAELGLEEYRSSDLLSRTLEESGFQIERGVAGMPTSFVANWRNGTGRPILGLLAEYDALPSLSQKKASANQEPLVLGAPGHGCGHNTMGAMQVLSAVVAKEILERHGLSATIKVFGSPAEELLVSRPFMVRSGLFENVDAVLDCHADCAFQARYGMIGNAMCSFLVTFYGKTAHAGDTPWLSRSAADAVELMHSGTERMREHVKPTSRTHWVTTFAGEAPNVVPDRSTTWYFVREKDENLEALAEWVWDCARGAALMTQTRHELKILGAAHQRFYNRVLAEALFHNIEAVGKPRYSPEEEAFAKSIQEASDRDVIGMDYDVKLADMEEEGFKGGSSDVGDVTLVVPTGSVNFPVWVPGCPSHDWTVTSAVATSIAHKGISAAAKAVASTIYDIVTEPSILSDAKKEFDGLTSQRPYRSFLPGDAEPPLGFFSETMAKYRGELERVLEKEKSVFRQFHTEPTP